MNDEQRKNFEELCDPLIKFLNENCHPHVLIVITPTDADLLEGICHIKNEVHVKD